MRNTLGISRRGRPLFCIALLGIVCFSTAGHRAQSAEPQAQPAKTEKATRAPVSETGDSSTKLDNFAERYAAFRQRLFLEMSEDLTDRPTECGLHEDSRLITWKRWHFVLQFGQFLGHVVWQQITPGRQDLAEFHVERSEVLQGTPNMHAGSFR